MRLALEKDSFGRLICHVVHGNEEVLITSSSFDEGITSLKEAVDSATTVGKGEAFWHEGNGDYRWLFRREGARLRVVVLWSTGTVTGWENKVWAECDPDSFLSDVRGELARMAITVS